MMYDCLRELWYGDGNTVINLLPNANALCHSQDHAGLQAVTSLEHNPSVLYWQCYLTQ